jgi:hypothetical protein
LAIYLSRRATPEEKWFGFGYAQLNLVPVAIGTALAGMGAIAVGGAATAKAAAEAATAYEIAKAGGRNARLLNNFATRSSEEIQRGINSLQRQAALHLDKIVDPATYATKWSEMGEQEQAGLLRYWAKEAARYAEQAEVVSGILKERQGGP